MNLAPREQDKLYIYIVADLARRRRDRGVPLNFSEAVALISEAILEGARDGKTVAECMELGKQVVGPSDVMDGVRDIGWTDLPCNFVQIMENAVDPHHVEFLHGRYFDFLGRQQGFEAPASFAKKHVKVGFDAFEWGIIKRRVV